MGEYRLQPARSRAHRGDATLTRQLRKVTYSKPVHGLAVLVASVVQQQQPQQPQQQQQQQQQQQRRQQQRSNWWTLELRVVFRLSGGTCAPFVRYLARACLATAARA